jgi:outer membrane protein assembly factor BamA
MRPGDIYSLGEYNKTLSNIAKTGVWQTTNIQVNELKDSPKIDLVIEMLPVKKFGFEASVEASYSATNNTAITQSGNLIGLSGNLSLVNRNIGREAISMTHKLRGGVELNKDNGVNNTGLLNSTEFSYSNNVVIPRNLPLFSFPFGFTSHLQRNRSGDSTTGRLVNRNRIQNKPGESFINTGISLNNRLQLFNLQTANLSLGKTWPGRKNSLIKTTTWIYKPFTAQFSYLYNISQGFQDILDANLFLRYSYNTSFVVGIGAGFSNTFRNPKHLGSLSKERIIRVNAEESGLTWAWIPVLDRYKARFVKLDGEYKYTVTYKKTAFVSRAFVGIGVPILKDSALPFFKQFFGGGTYSMRGWPVRGIGGGGKPLAPYKQNLYNDRTGDLQFEMNEELRYDIARLIPNLLTLRGAIFVDIGNVWNLNNGKKDVPGSITGIDSAQFKFKNFLRQLGVSAGTGFRLDFNYVVLRLDFGFRFKRPETSYINNGWKAPSIGFDDFIKKIFARGADDQYRKWRYENFNFTIGISYPF